MWVIHVHLIDESRNEIVSRRTNNNDGISDENNNGISNTGFMMELGNLKIM